MTTGFGPWNDPVELWADYVHIDVKHRRTLASMMCQERFWDFGRAVAKCYSGCKNWSEGITQLISNLCIWSVISLRSFSCSDIVKTLFGFWWKWRTSEGVHSKSRCSMHQPSPCHQPPSFNGEGCGYLPSGAICEVQCKVGLPKMPRDLEGFTGHFRCIKPLPVSMFFSGSGALQGQFHLCQVCSQQHAGGLRAGPGSWHAKG